MSRPVAPATGLNIDGLCPLLQVFDMPASLKFYRDVLGFTVIQSAPRGASEERFGWVWLQHGSAELMLNTAYDPDEIRPAEPEAGRVAAHRDTGLYIACPDVDAAYRYLRDRGIGVLPPNITHYGMKQLYVTDPDGFGLCLQWPANES